MVGAFTALLANVTFPGLLTALTGAKVTVNVALCPAAKVNGRLRPLKEYVLPEMFAEEIVTLAADAVSLPERLAVLPTVTLPKPSEVGLALSCGLGDTPVPVRETVGLFVASLVNEIWPETLPAVVGENFAV